MDEADSSLDFVISLILYIFYVPSVTLFVKQC
jgi:hypothetical protein